MKKITFDAPLLSHNTFGMNVKAAVLAEYETVSELREILTDPIIADLTGLQTTMYPQTTPMEFAYSKLKQEPFGMTCVPTVPKMVYTGPKTSR